MQTLKYDFKYYVFTSEYLKQKKIDVQYTNSSEVGYFAREFKWLLNEIFIKQSQSRNNINRNAIFECIYLMWCAIKRNQYGVEK